MKPELTEEKVIAIMDGYGRSSQQLIAILLDIQEASGQNYIDETWAALAAQVLGVPLAKIYEIITFYSMFSTSPRGRHIVEVCRSAPCEFKGAALLLGNLEELLGIKVGETSQDGLFTLKTGECCGACDKSSIFKIDEDEYGAADFDQKSLAGLFNSKRQESEAL
ncbi:MAG: NAD(P)H-dependent oxidoreductase subunit E [Deltaproteobacteria bacterium]|nr:NAD(P)H-dependent oxidoreductase subunit E [Deltaproteobacteria bacterium]